MELVIRAIVVALFFYSIFVLIRNTQSVLTIRRMPIATATFAWLAVLYVASALAELCIAIVFVLYALHADQEPLPFFLAVAALVFGIAAFVALRRLRSQHFAPTHRMW
jgi:hypothetical protein